MKQYTINSDIDAIHLEAEKKALKKKQRLEFEKTELHKLNEQMKLFRTISDIYFKEIKADISKKGWLKHVRTSLNIPQQYIADELGKKKQTIADFEKGELNMSISLKNLNEYAKKMGLRLVYYLEPASHTPIEFVRKHIEESVRQMPEKERVKYSYNPKQQGASSRRKEAYIRRTIENIPKSLYKSSKGKNS